MLVWISIVRWRCCFIRFHSNSKSLFSFFLSFIWQNNMINPYQIRLTSVVFCSICLCRYALLFFFLFRQNVFINRKMFIENSNLTKKTNTRYRKSFKFRYGIVSNWIKKLAQSDYSNYIYNKCTRLSNAMNGYILFMHSHTHFEIHLNHST